MPQSIEDRVESLVAGNYDRWYEDVFGVKERAARWRNIVFDTIVFVPHVDAWRLNVVGFRVDGEPIIVSVFLYADKYKEVQGSERKSLALLERTVSSALVSLASFSNCECRTGVVCGMHAAPNKDEKETA